MFKIYYFGLDYVRFNFSKGFKGLPFLRFFKGMSDNSNQKFGVHIWGLDFSCYFILTDAKEIVMFEYLGDAVFCISKLKSVGVNDGVSWTIDFYSTFFYINELRPILLNWIYKYEKFLTVSRIDIALDTSIPINLFWESRQTHFKKNSMIRNGEEIETFYLGSKANNKKHFIRVYNKKLDSEKKGKFHLFYHYLKEDCVTRTEVQININSVKALNIKPSLIFNEVLCQDVHDVFGTSGLWPIFLSLCCNERGTSFACLQEIISIKEKSGIIQTIKTKTARRGALEELDKIPYAKVFLGYARKLHDLGFDTHAFLDRNGISRSFLYIVPYIDFFSDAVVRCIGSQGRLTRCGILGNRVSGGV